MRWEMLKVWREVIEIERVAEDVERGWRRAKCCFLQWFCNGFAIGVGVSRGLSDKENECGCTMYCFLRWFCTTF